MARVRLLQPYNNEPVGSVIELPGGLASVLIPRRIAELTTDPVSSAPSAEKAAKPRKPKK
jgi:hypothetical protein